jgi:hypothetical protein
MRPYTVTRFKKQVERPDQFFAWAETLPPHLMYEVVAFVCRARGSNLFFTKPYAAHIKRKDTEYRQVIKELLSL